ncbi:MAG: hypothetical protein ABIP02_02420 [Arenimonas sp.]
MNNTIQSCDPEEQARRDAARLRYERRNSRLARLSDEKYLRQEEQKVDATSADAIAQALARAKAKREQSKKPT